MDSSGSIQKSSTIVPGDHTAEYIANTTFDDLSNWVSRGTDAGSIFIDNGALRIDPSGAPNPTYRGASTVLTGVEADKTYILSYEVLEANNFTGKIYQQDSKRQHQVLTIALTDRR